MLYSSVRRGRLKDAVGYGECKCQIAKRKRGRIPTVGETDSLRVIFYGAAQAASNPPIY